MQTIGPSLPLIGKLPTGLQTSVLFSILVIGVLVLEPRGLFGISLRIKRYSSAVIRAGRGGLGADAGEVTAHAAPAGHAVRRTDVAVLVGAAGLGARE